MGAYSSKFTIEFVKELGVILSMVLIKEDPGCSINLMIWIFWGAPI